MSIETCCNASGGEEPAFTDLLEANCSDMRVVTGRLEPCVCRERTRPEIEIAIPGERASAEIAYQSAAGQHEHHTVSDRHISIIPPRQPHQLNWLRCADLTLVRLTPEFVADIARKSGMRGAEIAGQYGVFDPVIWHLGRELRSELRRHRELDVRYLDSVAMVLAQHLLSTYASAIRQSLDAGGLPRYKLRRAVDYINDNIGEDISFRDIAAHLKMSAYHFARMFKQTTGESPHHYIVHRRMERAKALLADARLPISDVAFEVGYKSQSHFTTCFGRLTGLTPAAFRAGI
jgi:AraC family transcriptional regulator